LSDVVINLFKKPYFDISVGIIVDQVMCKEVRDHASGCEETSATDVREYKGILFAPKAN
jgi:hypothetical protein